MMFRAFLLLALLSGSTELHAQVTTSPAAFNTIPVTTDYTASGAIAITDAYSEIDCAGPGACAMTLAPCNVKGWLIHIKRYGQPTVTVTASIDGQVQTVSMNTTATQTESLLLRCNVAHATYFTE
jgi:hypothetical protein